MGLEWPWLPVYLDEKHSSAVSVNSLDETLSATRMWNIDANRVSFKPVSELDITSPSSVPSVVPNIPAPALSAVLYYFFYLFSQTFAGWLSLRVINSSHYSNTRTSGAAGKQSQQLNPSRQVPFSPWWSIAHQVKAFFSCLAGAVVIAFVVCWLPYHIRRLMFCYVPSSHWTEWVTTRGTCCPHARTGWGLRLGLGTPGHPQVWRSGDRGILQVYLQSWEQRYSPTEGLKSQTPNYWGFLLFYLCIYFLLLLFLDVSVFARQIKSLCLT